MVTNGTSSTQYKRLAASGLDCFMKDIFVSEDAGSQKPQKEYFDYCFTRIPDCQSAAHAASGGFTCVRYQRRNGRRHGYLLV